MIRRQTILLIALLIVGCDELSINEQQISDGTSVTDTLYVIDTLIVADTDTNIIHLDFVLLKFISPQVITVSAMQNCYEIQNLINCDHTCSGFNTTPLTGGDPCIDCSGICMGTTSQDECDLCLSGQYDCNGTCDGNVEYDDCNCDCGGSANKEIYYYDYDGDGLGGDKSIMLCPDISSEYNVVLNNDDDEDNVYTCLAFYSFDTSNYGMMLYDDKLEFEFIDSNYSVDITSCTDTTMISQMTNMIQYKEIGLIQMTNIEDGDFETQNIPYTDDDFNIELLFTIP